MITKTEKEKLLNGWFGFSLPLYLSWAAGFNFNQRGGVAFVTSLFCMLGFCIGYKWNDDDTPQQPGNFGPL